LVHQRYIQPRGREQFLFQPTNSVKTIQYLAVNLIHQPKDYIFFGIEGLWGSRTNRDGAEQDASRITVSFGFLLP
jgi:hypothetical protein